MSTATEYRDLLLEFMPRPIHSDADYRRAVRQLEQLMEPHPSTARRRSGPGTLLIEFGNSAASLPNQAWS